MIDEQKVTRARILGVLIQDARRYARRTVEDCARVMNISPEEFTRAEKGEYVISLPELEVLAMYLDVPMAHFWGTHALSEVEEPDYRELLHLRHKIIGGLLRQARVEAGCSVEDLAGNVSVDAAKIDAYEMGEEEIPFLELEEMAKALGVSIDYFLENEHGPLARHEAEQKYQKHIDELPPEIKEFVTKPVNIAYLQTAMRLSELDAEQLRSVAAGILEITY